MTTRAVLRLLVLAVTALLVSWGPAAHAEDGSIAHAEAADGELRVLVDVPPDADLDLAAATATLDGDDLAASAAPAGAGAVVERIAVLVMDVSNSMDRNGRFTAAKAAATAYLEAVPRDVSVGIVTFNKDVATALEPTTDRDRARSVVEALSLGPQTKLYDGLLTAIEVAGSTGQRSLLVLSDGADTGNQTSLEDVTAAVASTNTLVDVVSLGQRGGRLEQLEDVAEAGGGRVLTANGGNLARTFEEEAEVLADQVLVTAPLPDDFAATEATIEVRIPTADDAVVASAFVPIQEATREDDTTLAAPADLSGWDTPGWLLPVGIAVLAVGALAMAVALVPARQQPLTIAERVSAYVGEQEAPGRTRRDPDQLLDQARSAASGILERNQGLQTTLDTRLGAAGSGFKPAEWLILHVGVVLIAGLLGLLLGGGSIVIGLVFLVLGAALPPLYLRWQAGRRRRAFDAALPDTLQLLSGALAAGLSLAQAVDTVVREGTDPIAGEFKRVLVEHRVGVSLEDAFDGVAARFGSRDFAWVVMAIRIQRQVGGNLGEILTTVGNTIRERHYLRRQVKTLAAEGKLSAILLCSLPPGFALFLAVTNPAYMAPLFQEALGIAMLLGAVLWLSLGVFIMTRMVRMEV
ncbi:type II secretion system F family protein [Nocardioides panacisoli]|uniref:type II secretion system F family protein n=1 Tax=Nocardioides panacisoli TaxID=627624 RepID=UPI001C625F7E|nr:type II secretion system F family protein [Nocardioides panacisoli]QYJ04719.1 type II secretion system F family protein [Nocardioides panacisoli]